MSFTPKSQLNDAEEDPQIQVSRLSILDESELCLANGLSFLKRFNMKKRSKATKFKSKKTLGMRKQNKVSSSNSSLPETSSATFSNSNKNQINTFDYSLDASFLNKKRCLQAIPKCSWDSRESETKHSSTSLTMDSVLLKLFSGYNCALMLNNNSIPMDSKDERITKAQGKSDEQL